MAGLLIDEVDMIAYDGLAESLKTTIPLICSNVFKALAQFIVKE